MSRRGGRGRVGTTMVLFRLTERVITLTGCLYRRGRRGIGRRRKCHFFRFRYPRCELRVPPSPEPGHFQIPIVVPPTERKHASEVACREFPEKRVHEPPPRWDVLLGGFVVARGLFVFLFFVSSHKGQGLGFKV